MSKGELPEICIWLFLGSLEDLFFFKNIFELAGNFLVQSNLKFPFLTHHGQTQSSHQGTENAACSGVASKEVSRWANTDADEESLG